jgi:multidrug efflux pump
VIFIPYLGYIILPEIKSKHAEEHDVYQTRLYRILRSLITGCVHYRKSIILFTIIAFATGIYCFRFVEQQFFPSSNRPELLVDMRLPEGTAFTATEKQVLKLEALLKTDTDIENYVSYNGGGSPRFYLPMDLQLQNINYAQIVIMTKGMAARERVIPRLREAFVEQFPDVRGRVTRLENGPPVGYPVQFRVMGENIETVRRLALQVAEIMRQNPHTHDVHLDWNEKTKAVRLEVDQDKARSLGISSQQLSASLNTLLRGMVITEYRERDKLIEVIGRAVPEERGSLANLENLTIYLSNGKFVPLSQICAVTYGFEEGIIWRRNRFPTMTVRADVSDKVQAPDISTQINPTLNKLRAQLPPGYRIEMGGAIEESSKSQASIAAVMPFMLMVILVLLMIQLQSFQRTLLVLFTAPLGIIGLTLFLILFQRPFGFVAMLGAISLMGMIMRNSVILIDQIEQDRAAGMAAWTAIVESTVRRFRPIMLTAAAAILAMIPLSHNNFWGPMAIAIMGGLLVATLFTLFFLPALYAAWFRVQRPTVPSALS